MPTSMPNAGLDNPVLLLVILMSSIAIVAILSSLFGGGRKRRSTRPQTWIETERKRTAAQRDKIERQAQHIIATSSTAAIAGFEIIRQIEAVFTEGHASPQDAVAALKATAAEKGANALINLSGQRHGTGKCTAHADAVMVKPIESPTEPPPSTPEDSASGTNDHNANKPAD